MEKFYYCYSYPQKCFLEQNGCEVIKTSLHYVTHKRFWVFEGNEFLNELLVKWRKNAHKN